VIESIALILAAAPAAVAPDDVPATPAFPMAELIGYLALTFAALVGSAAFSGVETAAYAMSQLRLLVRETRGDRRAAILHAELQRPQRLLSTLLIGNNAVNFVASFGITAVLTRIIGLGDWASIVVQAVVLTPLLFVFGETLPKEFGRAYADQIIYRFARPLRFVRWLLTLTGLLPLVMAVGAVVARAIGGADREAALSPRARVASLIEEGVHHGVLSVRQTDIVDRALQLRRLSVRDVMVPWSNTSRLDARRTVGDLRRQPWRWRYTRYPVQDTTGRVVAVADLLQLLQLDDQAAVGRHAAPAVFVDPSTSLRQAMIVMQRADAPMAIVGHPRRPLGIVTRHDLAEPIVGELLAT